MITYKLNPLGTLAQQFIDGIATGAWANIETNETYLKWLEESPDNKALPADEVTE